MEQGIWLRKIQGGRHRTHISPGLFVSFLSDFVNREVLSIITSRGCGFYLIDSILLPGN
jgi:hypothetical protein